MESFAKIASRGIIKTSSFLSINILFEVVIPGLIFLFVSFNFIKTWKSLISEPALVSPTLATSVIIPSSSISGKASKPTFTIKSFFIFLISTSLL